MAKCWNCGAQVNSNDFSCRNCGAQMGQAPSPPPPPPPTRNQPIPNAAQTMSSSGGLERVAGVMLLRKPKSLGRYDSFTGIVTNRRIIFAQMTAEMLKDAVQAARDQAKAEGKGFWGQWEEQLRASFGYTQRYLTMDPNAALAETQGNFAVDNDAIFEVKLNRKDISKGQETHMHEFELEVKTSRGQYAFRMDTRDEYVRLLKQVYGERVKMPFGYFSGSVSF